MSTSKNNSTFIEKLHANCQEVVPGDASLVTRYVEGLPFKYHETVINKTILEAVMEKANFIDDYMALEDRNKGVVGKKRK